MEDINTENKKTREQLLSLINEEINRIRTEEMRPGWTLWALAGGLATCLWLLLGEFGSGQIDIKCSIILCVQFTLAVYWLKQVLFFLSLIGNENSSTSNISGRLILASDLLSNRFAFIIFIIWEGIMLFYLSNYSQPANSITVKLTQTYFGVSILLIIFGLVVSQSRWLVLPQKKGSVSFDKFKPKKYVIFIMISLFILTSTCMYGWFSYLKGVDFLIKIHEVKVASLLVGIIILSILITPFTSLPPMLNNLIDIRQELVLGDVPETELKRNVDLILRGITVSDYLSIEISKALTLFQRFEKILHSTVKKLDLYKNTDWQKELTTKRALDDSISKDLVLLSNIWFSEMDLLRRKTKRRIMYINLTLSNNNERDDSFLIEEINLCSRTNAENFNKLVGDWYNILKLVDGHVKAKEMIDQLNGQFPKLKFDRSTGLFSKGQ